jgi:hypothetical protein
MEHSENSIYGLLKNSTLLWINMAEKSELPDNFWFKYSLSNFIESADEFMG